MRGLLANKQKHILGLLAIFLFGLMGAYVVFRSKALESGPSIFFFIASGTYNETHQPGETFIIPILARGTVTALQANNQVQLNISYDSTRVKYLKSVCSTQIYCSVSTWKSQTTYAYSNSRTICIDFKAGRYTDINVITPHFEAVSSTPFNASPNYISLHWGATSGSCASNPNGSGITRVENHGACDPVGIASAYCNGPEDIGSNLVENEGAVPSNATTTTTNTSSSGGGSGSSTAKKQANQPNPVPTSSSQGQTEQPEQDPSPFFDGKEYKQGSDQDTLGSTANKIGKRLLDGWYLVLGVTLLGGASGFGYWWWRQHHKG